VLEARRVSGPEDGVLGERVGQVHPFPGRAVEHASDGLGIGTWTARRLAAGEDEQAERGERTCHGDPPGRQSPPASNQAGPGLVALGASGRGRVQEQ
jgi:hypothetical protein